MIVVRTNPKLVIAIVCIGLLASMFTVWRVTRTTDKVAQQGIELQQRAADLTEQAIKGTTVTGGTQTDIDTSTAAAQKSVDDASEQAAKLADDAAKQLAAATGEH